MAPRTHYVLKVHCTSRLGTVARISGFLADRGCYIEEMQQFDDAASGRFYLRCAFTPEVAAHDALRRDFGAVAALEDMHWSMHDSAEPMRVLILVSKQDHCLEDLLYRRRTGELAMQRCRSRRKPARHRPYGGGDHRADPDVLARVHEPPIPEHVVWRVVQ